MAQKPLRRGTDPQYGTLGKAALITVGLGVVLYEGFRLFDPLTTWDQTTWYHRGMNIGFSLTILGSAMGMIAIARSKRRK